MYNDNLSSNHCAHQKNIGCEKVMLAINMIINKMIEKYGKLYIVQDDSSKAFDKCNRKIIIIQAEL